MRYITNPTSPATPGNSTAPVSTSAASTIPTHADGFLSPARNEKGSAGMAAGDASACAKGTSCTESVAEDAPGTITMACAS
ncbi:MAG TPA: hypothetical protein VIE46_09445 [Gemmatimonadales bacterium]